MSYGVFSLGDGDRRIGLHLGEDVLDLRPLAEAGHVPVSLGAGSLDRFLAEGRPAWDAARAALADRPRLAAAWGTHVHRVADLTLHLPFEVRDYVDFFSSIEHATNLGRMMRPDGEPLLPNWRHVPIGYHGRSSTIVPSGTPVRRPCGQRKPADAPAPVFGPSTLLDFELEVGFVTGGPGNELGVPIPVDRALDHIFGMFLVNDWSARDIQAWEYQPLGPFLSKSFATSISPWVVPLDDLRPFMVDGPVQDPPPLPYLRVAEPRNLELDLEVTLSSAAMREAGMPPARISRGTFRNMYWSMAQQLAHMTVNGTVVRPGDLYASGTVSGPTPESRGSMIELTWRGAEPLTLPSGETRAFLEDGDEVAIGGRCGPVDFGQVVGRILPALSST